MKTDADDPGKVIVYILVGFCLMAVLYLITGGDSQRHKTPEQRIYDYQVEHRLLHGSPPPEYADPCAGKNSSECEEDVRKANCGFRPNSPGCPGAVKAKSRPNAPISLQDSSTDTNSEKDHTQ